MEVTIRLLGLCLSLTLGPDETDGPGDWATMSVTADTERDYPIGYAPPPDYDEEWRHKD